MRYSQLIEAAAQDLAVFYGGRFQPMHSGHHQVYMDLVNAFGSNNVFIATTYAKTATPDKDPFTFDEKKTIMTKMFGVPANHVINTQPYKPDVSLTGKDPNNTAVLLVYSAKDADRIKINGNTVREYKPGVELVPSTEAVYIYVADIKDDGRSATTFRDAMRSDSFGDEEKQKIFKDFFGGFNPDIYNFVLDKLK